MARGGEKPFLHFEIIINILKRLPVKSILRFRSVCKDWKNLFKTQSFIAEHTRHSAHESPLLTLDEYEYSRKRYSLRLLNQKMETVEVLSLPSNDRNHGWEIIGSCNGLLCVEVWPIHLLCLWNLVNREVRKIPQTKDNYRRHSMFGFGFSSIVNDYKIVRFFLGRKLKGVNSDDYVRIFHGPKVGVNSKVSVVKVYSLSTDSWKELKPAALQKTRLKFGTVSVDGTMSWLGDEDSLPVLVSFDIATEVFTLTPIPAVDRVLPTTLGVYQNKFVISGYHRASHFMDIWVMELVASESGKHFSCSEKYSVDVPSYGLAFDIFCIWGNEIVCCDKERSAWRVNQSTILSCSISLLKNGRSPPTFHLPNTAMLVSAMEVALYLLSTPRFNSFALKYDHSDFFCLQYTNPLSVIWNGESMY
ncbi:hypothetical protein QN277_005691 [Acacia crassicarpa]|uniref:F-box domain-containing protein n=1 Tax=Acacia crassicarpa TaxID=499986 RepID=A0AAE1J070_9FABA|nr:hypothetical protein QN277_005691 [Acacia crassicarpa]